MSSTTSEPAGDPIASRPVERMKSDSVLSKVAHTLTACCRCRQRKTRCDAGLPRCGPCERSNKTCEYYDTGKSTKISRSYVVKLQNRIQDLEADLAQSLEEEHGSLDAEVMIRSAGLVRFKQHDEGRYLGASSGIAMTRLVMELAKRNTDSKTIKEVVPDTTAGQSKDAFAKESSKPTSKVYPLVSDVAAPNLPSKELTGNLINVFNRTAQYLLPTLHEPSFRQDVEDVYQGSLNAYKNFALRMVIAISMQKLHTSYAGLADSYYLAALPFLESAVRPMSLETLQCFALIAQYSLVTPTRTASYWVVALATRLCQELGITEESGITADVSGASLTYLQIDMRRRLFWIITSMEMGLSHSLGRPSGFGTSADHIDVQFFEAVDDQYIGSKGVLPGAPFSMKKLIAIHFFKMRLLQAEIRRKLYLKKRPEPKTDQDPWFQMMDEKLNEWLSSIPRNDEGSGFSESWFRARFNTIVIFLYRPSPQIPEPSAPAALRCVEAALFNIRLQREQIANKSVDLTWVFTQTLFMELNTTLWALSYPEVRQAKSRQEVEEYAQLAKDGIALASERWPGVESALELYENLVKACLKVYDGSSETSYVIGSPSGRPSHVSLHNVVTPPALSSASTVGSSNDSSQALRTGDSSSLGSYIGSDQASDGRSVSPASSRDCLPAPTLQSEQYQKQTLSQPSYEYATSYQNNSFDPNSLYNTLPVETPDLYDPGYGGLLRFSSNAAFYMPRQDDEFYLGTIGDQYSQYLHAPYIPHQPLQSLSQEQQIERLTNLERTGLSAAIPAGYAKTELSKSYNR